MKYKKIPIIAVIIIAFLLIMKVIIKGGIEITISGYTYYLGGIVLIIASILGILYIAYFLIRFIDANYEKLFNKDKEVYFNFDHLNFIDKTRKENVIKRNTLLIEKIKNVDISFDEEMFLHYAKVIFRKLQRDALMKYIKNLRGSWDGVQSYVNYVYDNEIIDVEHPQIYYYNSSKEKDIIKVVLKSSIIYHVLELQDMIVSEIDEEKIAENISTMTFMKWKKRKKNDLP